MKALHDWHTIVRERDIAALERLLHPDAVFESPIVHTPQRGRAVTMAYLTAAMEVLGGDDFRYVGEWAGTHGAVLEFVTRIGEIEVNGVDILRFDETDERIVHFKVMVRPVKAIEALGLAMRKMLERAGAANPS